MTFWKTNWLWFVSTVALTISYAAYAWFSYSLTAPNLILSSWAPYWQWQMWMWKTFFDNRELLSQLYIGILTGMWVAYFACISTGRKVLQLIWNNTTLVWIVAGIVAFPLLCSMNALSYDVFNYQFNAKMLVEYQTNPHVHVALDFPDDPWVRFMHNTHTPAPYGYGWTALSLIPYTLGMGKLILTWLSFRLWSVVSWILLGIGLRWLIKQLQLDSWWWWAVLLNPLLLIEIIATQHNDLWMMVPAIISLGWLAVSRHRQHSSTPALGHIWPLIGSLLVLAASISIKLATVAVLPIWLCLALDTMLPSTWLKQLRSLLRPYWPVVAALALFLPLLSPRSQQFHPWYWVWVLSWIPLFPIRPTDTQSVAQLLFWVSRWIQITILTTSVVLLWRYFPYLAAGTFEGPIFAQQLAITWYGMGIAASVAAMRVFYSWIQYNKSS